jgi:hypothetical protein
MSPNGSAHDRPRSEATPDERPPCRAADADFWFSECPHQPTRAQELCYRCRLARLDIALRRPEL